MKNNLKIEYQDIVSSVDKYSVSSNTNNGLEP